MTDSAPLRRLARRVRVRAQVRAADRRATEALPAALQITVAAIVSYSIAHYLLGHPAPFVAVAVTITSLGLTRDARPRKVLETALGVTIGIALSELMVLVIGKGVWQVAIVLFVTLVVARAFSPNPAFAIAAAVQSAIVVIVPGPVDAVFTRSIDAVVAGVIALIVTALIPRDPRRVASRDARLLFSVFHESLAGAVEALSLGTPAPAELALDRLRRTQSLVDDWRVSLDTAVSVARISPWLRRHLPELRVQERVLLGADLASRHLRTITRRIGVIAHGTPRPNLAALMAELANAIDLLGRELDDRTLAGSSRTALVDLAQRLDPATLTPEGELRETLIVVLVRPLVVDLLVATGMPVDDARALLPPV
ncbi:MAG: hypothetical protein JWR04_2586 [Rhodoglobus sp.]|nr:hypothetical protein [Rhodoglobus sp.]